MEVQCFNKVYDNNNDIDLVYSITKCSKQIVKLVIGAEAKN